MVEPGDIEDILDDYQALKELYEQVSEEPLTSPMQEYLEMIQGAMEAVQGRVTRDEMESDWGGIRKDALIEYSKETITYYTDSEGRRRQRISHEWPDWVPVDWDDDWEEWRAAGGY